MNNCSFLWVKLSVVENIKSFNAHHARRIASPRLPNNTDIRRIELSVRIKEMRNSEVLYLDQ